MTSSLNRVLGASVFNLPSAEEVIATSPAVELCWVHVTPESMEVKTEPLLTAASLLPSAEEVMDCQKRLLARCVHVTPASAEM